MSEKPRDEVIDAISPQPHPPFPEQSQDPPGLESRLDPRPRFQARAYRPAGKLQGQVALITGGDSGIGRAVAVLFAREGADVAIVYLDEEQSDAEETRAHVQDSGRRCLLLPGDVTDPEFCQEAVKRTVDELGRLDILVNNAAFQQSVEEIEDLEIEQFEHTFHTNIFGYFYMVRAAVPHMDPGSVILQTGSITGLEGHPKMLDYSATKGAIHAFTKSLALNLLRRGIRVNCVAPGPVWTPLNPADRPAEEVADFGSDTPYGRPGQPEELAPTYVFLASNADSGFMTGEVLTLLGGQTVAG
jgi:NAD(P)-dependent dehydrogenase (short-subunit alcohol dehydrogenase family)